MEGLNPSNLASKSLFLISALLYCLVSIGDSSSSYVILHIFCIIAFCGKDNFQFRKSRNNSEA